MKDRFLNILIATFVFLLILNLFGPKQETVVVMSEPHFAVSKKSVVVPNYPTISLVNTTDNPIAFDSCKDMNITKDLESIQTNSHYSAFCKTYVVPAKQTQEINISALSPLFTTPANIGFELKVWDKKLVQMVPVEERGFLRALLATVFYAPILNFFIALLIYIPGHSLGLAIVAITIVVRLILLVPQHQMMVSARKMQEIQPKVKHIQEKHKGDQAKLGMELMELYKMEQVNPLGSCLPLLIQTPILIVLYWVLTSIQDHSNFYYIYNIFTHFDIQNINPIFLGVDLLAIGGLIGVGLSLLVGAAQYLQIWLSQRGRKDQPKGEVDPNSLMPDPELMNKFMLYGLPVMITVSTFFFPLGVGLYWFIGTLFMLVQQQVANKFAERDKASGVIILPPVSPKKGRRPH